MHGCKGCKGCKECKGACPLFVQIKTSKSRRMTLSGSELARPVCCCCCCCTPHGVLRIFKYVFNAFVLLFSFFFCLRAELRFVIQSENAA